MDTEKNKMIAEFMGTNWHRDKMSQVYIDATLRVLYNYHEDWNKLMPVVEKIEAMGHAFNITFSTVSVMLNPYERIARVDTGTKIEATYQAVILFIQHYNDKQKTK